MSALRSEEILLDHEAVARALKAPRAPQFASGLRTKYSLEDRLPGAGTLGSAVPPPTERQLEAMRPTSPPLRSSKRPLVLGLVLLALAAITGSVVYRDMHREPPAAHSQSTLTSS